MYCTLFFFDKVWLCTKMGGFFETCKIKVLCVPSCYITSELHLPCYGQTLIYGQTVIPAPV